MVNFFFSKKLKKRRKSAEDNNKNIMIFLALFSSTLAVSFAQEYDQNSLDLWQSERPSDMAKIQDLEVMCGKRHMEVSMTFDRPFNGIVFSKGAVDRYNCIYVKPQTGLQKYKFDIMYDSCGSKPDLNGRFYENNIVVQYDQDLIEVWDEAKRLRCEWFNDYEKGVTKPPIRVSDLEVIELNFRGDNVDCWMEIQSGKGPWASPVTGIVPLGATLTLVVGIDDKQGEFDMRVTSCEASDGKNRPIQLSDGDGCVLRPKMVSKFMKMKSTDPRATVVTYAFFHAFKFPDSMSVQLKCKVEICRFGCADHCQSSSNYDNSRRQQNVVSSGYSEPNNIDQYASPQFKRQIPTDNLVTEHARSGGRYAPEPPIVHLLPKPAPLKQQGLQHQHQQPPIQYQDQVTAESDPSEARKASNDEYESLLPPPPPPLPNFRRPPLRRPPQIHPPQAHQPQPHQQQRPRPPRPQFNPYRRSDDDDSGNNNNEEGGDENKDKQGHQQQDRQEGQGVPGTHAQINIVDGVKVKSEAIPVPLGRRPPLDALRPNPNKRKPSAVPISRTKSSDPEPLVYPSSFNAAERPAVVPLEKTHGSFPYGPRALNVDSIERKRKRRSVSARNKRSADIGVSSGYDVVSEVDLDFNPSNDGNERTIVLKGKIVDDVVDGICLPASGFSALFVVLALLTVISVLMSGFVCYQRTLRKAVEKNAPAPPPPPPPAAMQMTMEAEAASVAAVAAAQVRQERQWIWFKKNGVY